MQAACAFKHVHIDKSVGERMTTEAASEIYNCLDCLLVFPFRREMLISSIAMAIGWQLLYQFVLKAACDVPVANAQSEVVFAEEAVRVDVASGASKGFKSRLVVFNNTSYLFCEEKGSTIDYILSGASKALEIVTISNIKRCGWKVTAAVPHIITV